jgi:hypothetical protein
MSQTIGSVKGRLRTIGALVLGALAIGACSSGHGVSGIDGFKACGGSLTGSWRVVATENDFETAPPPPVPGVPVACSGFISSRVWNTAGVSITFVPSTSNDPSVALYMRSIEGNLSLTETLSISAGCASEGFGGATCDVIAASLEPDGEGRCNASEAPCTCTMTIASKEAPTVMVAAHDGSYETAEGLAWGYCRDGDTLEQAAWGVYGNIVTWMRLQRK